MNDTERTPKIQGGRGLRVPALIFGGTAWILYAVHARESLRTGQGIAGLLLLVVPPLVSFVVLLTLSLTRPARLPLKSALVIAFYLTLVWGFVLMLGPKESL